MPTTGGGHLLHRVEQSCSGFLGKAILPADRLVYGVVPHNRIGVSDDAAVRVHSTGIERLHGDYHKEPVH